MLPSFVPVVHGVPRLRESVEINREQFGHGGRSGGCPERRDYREILLGRLGDFAASKRAETPGKGESVRTRQVDRDIP